MKNQERFDELLTLYVDGDISTNQQMEFDQLVEQNPEWKKQAEEEKRLVELMRSAPKATAPINLIQSVMENVHDVQPVALPDPAPEKKKSNKVIVIGFAAAAAAAVVLGAISTMIMVTGKGEERTVAKAEIKPQTTAPLMEAAPEKQPGNHILVEDAQPGEVTLKINEAELPKDTFSRSTEAIDQDGDADIVMGVAPSSQDFGNDYKGTDQKSVREWNYDQEVRSNTISEGNITAFSAPTDREKEEVAAFSGETAFPDTSASVASSKGRQTEELAYYYSMSDTSPKPAAEKLALESLETSNEDEGSIQTRDEQQTIEMASFETFMTWMKDKKGSFLFYTPDEEVAFHVSESAEDFLAKFKVEEKQEDTPKRKKLALRSAKMTTKQEVKDPPTPIPPNAKSGYVLFHFRSKKEATIALEKMKTLGGEGVKDLDLDKAVLVDQPDGVRLVIPYELMKIDSE